MIDHILHNLWIEVHKTQDLITVPHVESSLPKKQMKGKEDKKNKLAQNL